MPAPSLESATRHHIAPKLGARVFPFTLDNSDIVSILGGTPFEVVPAVAGKVLVADLAAVSCNLIDPYLIDGNPHPGVQFELYVGNERANMNVGLSGPNDASVVGANVGFYGASASDIVGQPLTLRIASGFSAGIVTGGDAGNVYSGTIAVAVLPL